MQSNIILKTNVGKSQIRDTGTHWEIKNIPVTVDDAVMNGVHYPAEENAKGMPSMIGKPVTLSHPVDENGNYTTGREGVGLESFFSGGTITNTYNIRGVNYADARIKKSLLEAQDRGEWFANALKSKMAIGVSTGLTIQSNEINGVNSKGQKYAQSAVGQSFDHLAMLEPNEAPAGGDATFMRFNAESQQNVIIANVDEFVPERSLFEKFMDEAKAFFAANHDTGYNDPESGHKPATNSETTVEVNDVKDKLLAIMANMEISIENAESMTEEQLLNAMSDFKKKDKIKVEIEEDDDDEDEGEKVLKKNSAVPAWAQALQNKLESMEAKLNAKEVSEVDQLAEMVSKLETNSIPKEEAAKLSVSFLKNHLAANGHLNVNAANGAITKPVKSSVAEMKMPGVK